MQREDFMAELAREGFEEIVTVAREANGALDVHRHPFEAKALVLQGALWIAVDGRETAYPAGSVFHLAAEAPHAERYGPDGVQYLVGRKPGR